MYLWNLIRDFYVRYIFGGLDSNYQNNVTNFMFGNGRDNGTSQALRGNIYVDIGNGYELTVCDWLSTSFTIITLIVGVIVLFLMLRWLFKVVSGLLLLRN